MLNLPEGTTNVDIDRATGSSGSWHYDCYLGDCESIGIIPLAPEEWREQGFPSAWEQEEEKEDAEEEDE